MKFFKIIAALVTSLVMMATPALAFASTLSLSPSSGTYNRGCSFTLDINLDTQGTQTDGTDAIVFYDPSILTANSISNGTIYQDYPGNNIDAQNGKITVSGLASVTQAFSGQGTLATLNMTVKDNATAGVTQMRFDFDPNNKTKTTDSNVVERGSVTDTLSSVVDGNYTVGTGSCGSAAETPTVGGSTGGTVGQGGVPASGSGYYKTLPSAGSEQLTFTLAIVGSVLTVLGILGLALL